MFFHSFLIKQVKLPKHGVSIAALSPPLIQNQETRFPVF
jgi:hypothetical protein